MTAAALAAYLDAAALVGNPSSIHAQGQSARRLLEDARHAVAAALGADAVEVTFTSGGTESINLALKGLWWSRTGEDPARRRILSTRAEHHATLDALEWLAAHEGAEITWIPVDAVGRIDVGAFTEQLGPDVAFATSLWANNEVGSVQPVAELARLAAAHGVPLHIDAVGAAGMLPVDVSEVGAAAVSVSAHKVGGPVGVGALVLARTASVTPLIHGGSQQRGRSGTMDVAGAHSFAVALAEAERRREAGLVDLTARRDRLVHGILATIPGAVYRGDPVDRLPGNAHVTFPGSDGDALLYLLDEAGFSVSTGSACQAGVPEPSHVLIAMGVPAADARGALRFTLGWSTTDAEIDALLEVLPSAVARARAAVG
jgi:cysteine desulfurase